MAQRKSFLHALAKAQREAERQRAARVRAENQFARAAAKAQREYERTQREYQRTQVADQKERAKLYVESRLAQVNLQNEQLEEQIDQLNNLLSDTLGVDDYFDLNTLKQSPAIPVFNPGKLGTAESHPDLQGYLPANLSGIRKLIPGAKEKHAQEVAKARERYEADVATYAAREATRQVALAELRAKYDHEVAEVHQKVAEHNAEIDKFQQDLATGVPSAVTNYFTLVLEASSYPEGFPQHAKTAYVPESKQLVVEYDLPGFNVVPETGAYKYVKAKDEVTSTVRSLTQRKAVYSSIIGQVTLRTLHELFESDRIGYLETVVFNGYVDTIDRGTGRSIRSCIVTVRTTRDMFDHLNLSKVDPVACLKVLNASVSKNPSELVPVRPVLEFSMVDPRFIQETDVLSELDQRPNLMELTPSEFESLIANLFQTMGLETRLTQASRDGGVDCVAFDPRPIFGGKVVIQAKRYKHTVGVSAVRDLFGTVQNEGASKGILVTTSGFGKAAYDFAEGKPLELLSGSHLLYLLAEHAGVEAKIEPPDSWKDPQLDMAP